MKRLHPALLHNGIWAGLAAGAAATPMEWNDSSAWGHIDDQMYEQMAHLATFVTNLPLAHLNPIPVDATTNDEDLRIWGLIGAQSSSEKAAEAVPGVGFLWVQDTAPFETSDPQGTRERTEIIVILSGLPPGSYIAHPFDTWQGVYLDESRVTTDHSGNLAIPLPAFSRDIAVRLEQER